MKKHSEQDILDILETASYGLSSWTSRAWVDMDTKNLHVDTDNFGGCTISIGLDSIAEVANRYDIHDIDVHVADEIVQTALFGEVVFG